MILKAYFEVAEWTNLVAGASNWFLLGGFVTMPNALPKLQNSATVKNIMGDGRLYHAIQSVTALVLGACFWFIGAIGIGTVWWINRGNRVWIKDRLFLYVAILGRTRQGDDALT